MKRKVWFLLTGSLVICSAQPSLAVQAVQDTAVTVCILDSGCGEKEAAGRNYLGNSEDLSDPEGHGTRVYQLLREEAPQAQIFMLKCLYGSQENPADLSQEERTAAEEAAVIKALYDAADRYHADLINISWTLNQESEALHAAVSYAYEQGCILVAAAGNLSLSTPLGSEVYPAAWEETIGAGGAEINDQGEPVSSLWYLQSDAVFVCADGSYEGEKGTSYAAPRITAAIAEYLQTAPEEKRTDEDVREYLKRIAQDLGEEGYDPVFGWGYIAGN